VKVFLLSCVVLLLGRAASRSLLFEERMNAPYGCRMQYNGCAEGVFKPLVLGAGESGVAKRIRCREVVVVNAGRWVDSHIREALPPLPGLLWLFGHPEAPKQRD
jgi:hypothetical protein